MSFAVAMNLEALAKKEDAKGNTNIAQQLRLAIKENADADVKIAELERMLFRATPQTD